jgi:hypothetical protein
MTKKSSILKILVFLVIFIGSIVLWGFAKVGIFMAAFFLGLMLSVILNIMDDEKQEKFKKEQRDNNKLKEMKIKAEENKKRFEKESENIKTVKLSIPETFDAYYSNDTIFAAFNLADIFPDSRKEWPIYAGQEEDHPLYKEHRDNYFRVKNSKRTEDTFGHYFPEIVKSRMVKIYSKTENKFVDEIKIEEWNVYGGPLASAGGYKYYLPDGTEFLKYQSWVS